MSESIRAYLLAVVAAAMLTALVLALVPEGPVRRVCRLACGLVLILVTLSPLGTLDVTALSRALSRLSIETDAAQTGVEVRSRALICSIIKQKMEAYILDKAAGLGLTVTADVSVDDSGAYPYPARVTITGSAGADARRALTESIERELAIPEERQEWRSS